MAEAFRHGAEPHNGPAATDEQEANTVAEPPTFSPAANFEWRALSAPAQQVYADSANPQIVQLLRFPPRFALEVGCNTGMLGQLIKQHFPEAVVWGVEPNQVTATMARARLDNVLECTLEEVDWMAEGVERGQIDTVFLFDVLEHIYDPWDTLLKLRNLVSSDAQLLISVPNVRNVLLIQDLIHGYWRYRDMGLLDITHIRFFTDHDFLRAVYQTGFRVVGRVSTFCQGSQSIHQRFSGKPFPQTIELDRATITVQSEDDLLSLCAVQNIFSLIPVEYDQLTEGERALIDAPHPPTYAYAGARPQGG